MLTFIRYDLRGQENIQKGTSYIYVSNHTSFLDIPGVRLLIPGEFRPIAKRELLKIPVFGFIVKAATVVVDRSSAQSRKQSMEELREILKGGISIWYLQKEHKTGRKRFFNLLKMVLLELLSTHERRLFRLLWWVPVR